MNNPEVSTAKELGSINANIFNIQKDITEIKANFKELAGAFITKQALEEIAKRTEERLQKLENERSLWQWLNPLLASILGSIMTFLIISYIQSK